MVVRTIPELSSFVESGMSIFTLQAVSFAETGKLILNAGQPTTRMILAELPPRHMASAAEEPAMEPFQRVQRDATTAMEQRGTLLAQSAEYFQNVFGGRTPTLHEKLSWIEERVRESASWITYRNNIYLVVIEMTSPLIHACIRRHDRRPCTDWNHMQQIKSELIGPEHEAVELFPAESRLINTTNEYHLWAHPKSGFRFPFGFSWNRFVMNQTPSQTGSMLEVAGG
ncbi:MAG: hypothetical protein ABJF10_00785 [Chthoniobacter sp.]|uniref:DUF7694 domain-containing protein n=1 Tax=Chthoniobacter sp. TaxID=2510640 RepID=UPI0032A59E6E